MSKLLLHVLRLLLLLLLPPLWIMIELKKKFIHCCKLFLYTDILLWKLIFFYKSLHLYLYVQVLGIESRCDWEKNGLFYFIRDISLC